MLDGRSRAGRSFFCAKTAMSFCGDDWKRPQGSLTRLRNRFGGQARPALQGCRGYGLAILLELRAVMLDMVSDCGAMK